MPELDTFSSHSTSKQTPPIALLLEMIVKLTPKHTADLFVCFSLRLIPKAVLLSHFSD